MAKTASSALESLGREFRNNGSLGKRDPHRQLRSIFQNTPGLQRLLPELETEPEPWRSEKASWGRRLLGGQDTGIGETRNWQRRRGMLA
jgi:hypothetical protein